MVLIVNHARFAIQSLRAHRLANESVTVIRYDHYYLPPNYPSKTRHGAWLNDFAKYKPILQLT